MLHLPSGLLIEAIPLCSTGINFGQEGVAIVLKQKMLRNKISHASMPIDKVCTNLSLTKSNLIKIK